MRLCSVKKGSGDVPKGFQGATEYDRKLYMKLANAAFDADEALLRLEAEKRREQGPKDPKTEALEKAFADVFSGGFFTNAKSSRNKADAQESADGVQTGKLSHADSLLEERTYYTRVMELFGVAAYNGIARKMQEEAKCKGEREPQREEICKYMLENMKPPKAKRTIETITKRGADEQMAVIQITLALNDIKERCPELKIVSPIQCIKYSNEVAATVTYEIYKF